MFIRLSHKSGCKGWWVQLGRTDVLTRRRVGPEAGVVLKVSLPYQLVVLPGK